MISLQVYYLLCGTGSFESDPEGEEEYQTFFAARLEEIVALGPKSWKRIFGFLTEEVFGIKRKLATAEQRRQKEFSMVRLQEIRAQAAQEDAEEQDEEGGEGEGDEGDKGDEEGEAAGEN